MAVKGPCTYWVCAGGECAADPWEVTAEALYSSLFARWCMERESGVLLAWLMSGLSEGQFRDILER